MDDGSYAGAGSRKGLMVWVTPLGLSVLIAIAGAVLTVIAWGDLKPTDAYPSSVLPVVFNASRRPFRSSWRRGIASAVLLLALVSCSSAEPSSPSPSAASPSSAKQPSDALPPYVQTSIKLSPQPNFVIGAFGHLWVTVGDGSVAEIDPSTNKVVKRVRVGGKPGPLAAGFGSLWVGDSAAGHLVRIDPRKAKVVARIPLPGAVYGVAVGFGSVWATGVPWQGLARIDPTTDKVIARKHADGNDIAAGFGSVWVTGPSSGVTGLSPDDLSVQAHVKTRTTVHSLAVGLGSLWASAGDAGDYIFRIDPKRDALVASVKADESSFPDRIAFSNKTAWVGEFQAGAVLGIDSQKNKVVRRLKAGDGSAVVTVAFGSLWVDNYYSNSVWRIPVPPKGS